MPPLTRLLQFAALHMSASGTSRRFAVTHQSGRFSNRPAGVKYFQAIHTSVSMSLTGSCFSPDSAPRPFHHGIRDEVEQSIGRPCRQFDGRSKRPDELTSSIVPRGTSFHGWVDLRFSPI